MNILVVLVPISLVLGGFWLVMFVWSLRAHQYEDLEGDAQRVLLDEEFIPKEPKNKATKTDPQN